MYIIVNIDSNCNNKSKSLLGKTLSIMILRIKGEARANALLINIIMKRTISLAQ
jgi:hypothetical protein